MFFNVLLEKRPTFIFAFYGNFDSLKLANIGMKAILNFHFVSLLPNLIFFALVADVKKITVVAVIDFSNVNLDVIDPIVDLASFTVDISSNVMCVCVSTVFQRTFLKYFYIWFPYCWYYYYLLWLYFFRCFQFCYFLQDWIYGLDYKRSIFCILLHSIYLFLQQHCCENHHLIRNAVSSIIFFSYFVLRQFILLMLSSSKNFNSFFKLSTSKSDTFIQLSVSDTFRFWILCYN